MDVTWSSFRENVIFQILICLILMVITTNANVKGYFKCTTPEKDITCYINDLPNVTSGSFDCVTSPYVSRGDACTLTCNNGFYPDFFNQAVCQKRSTNNEGKWSDGNFTCHECENWNERDGKEYKFIRRHQDWSKSRQVCEQENTDLVTIKDEEENDFLLKLIKTLITHCNGHWGTWIGLNDLAEEGTWEWNNKIPTTYTNWDGKDPGGGYEENCAMMKSETGGWNDYPCNHRLPAMCERNISLK